MDLFPHDPDKNLLPEDGSLKYMGRIMALEEADRYFQRLLKEIEWRQDEVVIFGKKIITKRKVAWYGDKDFSYTYSGRTRTALPWTAALLELKAIVEELSGSCFNSCLLNLYHSGEEGMSWHSDNEKELGEEPVIASLSLGAERKFAVKHKESKEKLTLQLENGSLLVMSGPMQQYWLHSLPKTKKVHAPRINLTFRNIREL